MRTILIAACLALCACASMAPQAPVDRAALTATLDAYLGAMTRHDASALRTAPDAKITYNGAPAKLEDGLFARARAIPYRRIFIEEAARQAGLYGVAEEENGAKATFYLRIKTDARGAIAELEVVDAHKGEASVFDADRLIASGPKGDEPILPLAERTPRAAMIAAANAYFDSIETSDGSIIPAAPECQRNENGFHTAGPDLPGNGCQSGMANLSYIEKIRDRRHLLIDEARGLIWSLVIFDIPGGDYPNTSVDGVKTTRNHKPRGIYIAELFSLRAGKIIRIDVIMRNTPVPTPSAW
jgi:hypothetical protein